MWGRTSPPANGNESRSACWKPTEKTRSSSRHPSMPDTIVPTETATIQWTKKDLLGLRELSPEEIRLALSTAESFREISQRPIKKVPALRGKTVVNLFFEPSTRTRTS